MKSSIGRRTVLFGSLFVLSPTLVKADEPYSNAQYGFAFTVPEGWEMRTPESPVPQHGILLVRAARSIHVGAAYDALLLGSTEAAMQEFLEDNPPPPGGERSEPQHAELDDLQGERVQLTIGQRIDVFVIAYRAPPDRNDTGIIYSLGLLSDRENQERDLKSFDRIVRSFKTLNLRNPG
jgi:hypothetical protein